ncbi:hypothetical protein IIB51_03050 [Patescibacteria group bacterium]|nr:hypothetical protein [Patescibacteria group bacterium]
MNPDDNKKQQVGFTPNEIDGVVFENDDGEVSIAEIEEEAIKKTDTEKNESPKSVGFNVEDYGKTLLKPLRTFALDLKEAQKGGALPTKRTKEKGIKVPKKSTEVHEKKQEKISVTELRKELARSGILPAEEHKEPVIMTSVPIIHTYREDVTSLVKDKHLSVASIATAASKKRQKNKTEAPEESSVLKNVILVALSIVLIGGGSFSGWFFYQKSKQAEAVPKESAISSIIFANMQLEVAFSMQDNVIHALEANDDVTKKRFETDPGTILHIYPTLSGEGREMRIDEFFAKLTPAPPGALVRSLLDEYMIGFHGAEGALPAAPFLILTTDSFENTFRGMLDWEKDVRESLSPLFGTTVFGGDSPSSDSFVAPTGTIPMVLPSLFEDVILKNVNTRRIRSGTGDLVLLYAFPNAKTIIITTNEDTLFDVFKLLSAS